MRRRDALKVLAGSLAGGVLGLPKLPAKEENNRPGPCEVRWFRFKTLVPGRLIFYDARDVIPLWKESGEPSEAIPGCILEIAKGSVAPYPSNDPIQYLYFNATKLYHSGYAYYAAVRVENGRWEYWSVTPYQLDKNRINMLFTRSSREDLELYQYEEIVEPVTDTVWAVRQDMIHEIITSGKSHTRSRRFPKADLRWRTNHYSL